MFILHHTHYARTFNVLGQGLRIEDTLVVRITRRVWKKTQPNGFQLFLHTYLTYLHSHFTVTKQWGRILYPSTSYLVILTIVILAGMMQLPCLFYAVSEGKCH